MTESARHPAPPPVSHLFWAVPVMMVWGSSYVVIKAGLRETTPFYFAAMRAIPAGLVLLAASRRADPPAPLMPVGLGNWLRVISLGLLCTGLFFAAMFAGTPMVGAGLAAILINTQPLFVSVLAFLLYRERLGAMKWASLMVGFLGVAFVVWPKLGSGPTPEAKGMVILLSGSLCFAGGMTLSKALYARFELLWLTGWQLLIGLFLLACAAVFENAGDTTFSGRLLGLVTYISFLGTVLPSVVWFRLVRFHSVSVLAAFSFLSPVVGVILAVLIYGETFSTIVVLGMLLVILSLFGMSRGNVPVRR